ncbi:MAG: hypothetical protein IJO56_06635 [Oscillospiraceae bacterium]|nr:hypothetical protein [Oscillospiraceae bacterium]
MDENTYQTPRRRKKQTIPKWQRVLRKYWPPVRFGMICFIVLAILILIVDGIIGLFTSDAKAEAAYQPGIVSIDTVPTASADVPLEFIL